MIQKLLISAILLFSFQHVLASKSCRDVAGFRYRCISFKACEAAIPGNFSYYNVCGPHNEGICCPIINKKSNPRCGIRRPAVSKNSWNSHIQRNLNKRYATGILVNKNVITKNAPVGYNNLTSQKDENTLRTEYFGNETKVFYKNIAISDNRDLQRLARYKKSSGLKHPTRNTFSKSIRQSKNFKSTVLPTIIQDEIKEEMKQISSAVVNEAEKSVVEISSPANNNVSKELINISLFKSTITSTQSNEKTGMENPISELQLDTAIRKISPSHFETAMAKEAERRTNETSNSANTEISQEMTYGTLFMNAITSTLLHEKKETDETEVSNSELKPDSTTEMNMSNLLSEMNEMLEKILSTVSESTSIENMETKKTIPRNIETQSSQNFSLLSIESQTHCSFSDKSSREQGTQSYSPVIPDTIRTPFGIPEIARDINAGSVSSIFNDTEIKEGRFDQFYSETTNESDETENSNDESASSTNTEVSQELANEVLFSSAITSTLSPEEAETEISNSELISDSTISKDVSNLPSELNNILGNILSTVSESMNTESMETTEKIAGNLETPQSLFSSNTKTDTNLLFSDNFSVEQGTQRNSQVISNKPHSTFKELETDDEKISGDIDTGSTRNISIDNEAKKGESDQLPSEITNGTDEIKLLLKLQASGSANTQIFQDLTSKAFFLSTNASTLVHAKVESEIHNSESKSDTTIPQTSVYHSETDIKELSSGMPNEEEEEEEEESKRSTIPINEMSPEIIVNLKKTMSKNLNKSNDEVAKKKIIDPYTSHNLGGRLEFEPWPWVVSIYAAPYMKFICAGTLIDERHVLSAAHCFYNLTEINLSVSVGKLLKVSRLSDSMEVEKAFLHEGFEPSCYCNDVAVLRLAKSLNPDYTPVCLAKYDTATVDENVTLLGWGDTKHVDDSEDSGTWRLQKVTGLHIVSTTDCRTALSNAIERDFPSNFEDYVICAGVPDGSKDSCKGDSGGPLLHEDYYGVFSLIGVVSFGYECGQPGVPAAYSRVSYYLPWILRVMNDS